MKALTLILTTLLLGAFTLSGEETPSAQDIANKAATAAYYQGKDGGALVSMTITDARGRERSRELVILRRDVGEDLGDQQFYVYFKAPADVSETAFLVWKHPQASDDRWLYLPALDLVRRIAASDERTSFVGSHFFYEDVSGRSPVEDNHELVAVTEHYFELKSTPKDSSSVEFTYFKSWIHKPTGIAVKTEFYNSKNEVYRMYEALGVETIDGHPTVIQAKMTDNDRGGSTVLKYSNIAYDRGLEESMFAERYLRNPPMEFLEF
ncbi:MAG: outer membrane lipoprotein-sorting protein [Verrucomicrobia bacterium]|nr:outer membrane lipoprotein-sorting protein [Verrucomicrobiota bacterium]MDA1066882.1 outer membrane lipoprotein-sorting protein [Verrucomicrobiota bacterium]